MIIVMSALGLTSSDLEAHSSRTGGSRSTRLSTMRFESGRPAATVASLPGLTTETTTSGISYQSIDDSVLDIRKEGEHKLTTHVALR